MLTIAAKVPHEVMQCIIAFVISCINIDNVFGFEHFQNKLEVMVLNAYVQGVTILLGTFIEIGYGVSHKEVYYI
jgi:hypothetical protein